jgi:hypothetical protein
MALAKGSLWELIQTVTTPVSILPTLGAILLISALEAIVKPTVLMPILCEKQPPEDTFLLGVGTGAGFAIVETIALAIIAGEHWGLMMLITTAGAAFHPLSTGIAATGWRHLLQGREGGPSRFAGHIWVATWLQALWRGAVLLSLSVLEPYVTGIGQGSDGPTHVLLLASLGTVILASLGAWLGLRETARRTTAPSDGPLFERLCQPTGQEIALLAIASVLLFLPMGLVLTRELAP